MTTKQKGRPTKFTKETTEKICQYIQEGNYIDTACRLAGVDYTTMRKWFVQGEAEGKGQFYEFAEAVRRAEAVAEAERVACIIRAGKYDDWKANAWYLERKYPERWGKQERLEATVKSEHTERKEHFIEHQIDTDPETIELVRQLWRRQQALGEN